MQTTTTGPALATTNLARSVQALRDGACARPPRSGWREAFVRAAAADAVRVAIVALLDALLGLIHEAMARARLDGVDPLPTPCPTEAVRAGRDPLHAEDAEHSGQRCEPIPARTVSRVARRRHTAEFGPTLLPVPAPESLSGEPTSPRSTARRLDLPRQSLPHPRVGRAFAWQARSGLARDGERGQGLESRAISTP